jgi:two-component system response regulator FixJ
MRKLSLPSCRHPMIFIIDDDRDIRDSLRFLLSCEGLASRSFATADQFLATQVVTDRDFLITDMNLPGMSGLELLAAVRKRGLALPVVLMTGQASPRLRQRALAGGATAFLEKPLKDAEILSLIRRGDPPGR